MIRLISPHDLAGTAERDRMFLPHRLPDPVSHEPSGLVRDLQHPMELVRRDALLARGHQVKGEYPLGQRDMAALHHRAIRNREMATAGVALMQAGAV